MQYIQPQHHAQLGQAELLVVDEAAAIPLQVVKAMLGPYLVFLCSTVNGCAIYPDRCDMPHPYLSGQSATVAGKTVHHERRC